MVKTSRFQLSGLGCSSCEKVIAKRLQTIVGVQEVHVQAQSGLASVTAPREISKEEVVKALEGTHYKVI